ncbi:MAG: ribonuclease HII [Firmicutes bacterium]|nr:ribonuclease HII [Bacillota bacterium]MCL2255901.1 ribonuclease HII [Bacillota bacterium]
MTKENRTERIFEFDKNYLPKIIAGMDEAGRGSLAGPLVVACCIMPLDSKIEGVYDSKTLSKERRDILYERIIEHAVAFEIMESDVLEIDELNVLGATKRVMRDIISQMSLKPSIVLVDYVPKLDLPIEHQTIKKGDQTSYNIACASILAKVHRDRLMIKLDEKYPFYGFKNNKGYGVEKHIESLKKFGKSPVHRETFIKNFFIEQTSIFK